jgi:hypothetical protein
MRNRTERRWFAWIAPVVALAAASACSDVGDSTALPGDSGTGPGDATVVPSDDGAEGDGSAPSSDANGGDAGTPSQPDAETTPDTGSSEPDSTTPEPDSATPEPDAQTTPDSSTSEPDASDSGPDATIEEAGVPDAQGSTGPDAAPEASVPDAEAHETGAPEGGGSGPDASEAGGGGGGLVPCTSAGQTNCVQCQGNTTGVCSPTEAILVQVDITQKVATAAGADSDTGCYGCLLNVGCIDDDQFSDTGKECTDTAVLPANFKNGAGTTVNSLNTCLDALTCIVGGTFESQTFPGGCGATNGGVTNCFCGPGGGGPGACPSAGAATNGVCKTQEVAGFKDVSTDSTDILGKDFTDQTEPTGMANQIISCGLSVGNCTQCLP